MFGSQLDKVFGGFAVYCRLRGQQEAVEIVWGDLLNDDIN